MLLTWVSVSCVSGVVTVPPKEIAVPLIVMLELAKSAFASCPVMFDAPKSTANFVVLSIVSLTIPPLLFKLIDKALPSAAKNPFNSSNVKFFVSNSSTLPTVLTSVSYTHLTLPTIYSV